MEDIWFLDHHQALVNFIRFLFLEQFHIYDKFFFLEG